MTVSPNASQAASVVIEELHEYERKDSFVRVFAYVSGASYGVLLDQASPGWTLKLKPSDDLGDLLESSLRLAPRGSTKDAEKRYGGRKIRAHETQRKIEHDRKVHDLRLQFVEGPLLILPMPLTFTFATSGVTPIPGEGTVWPHFRVVAEWGELTADNVLVSADRLTLRLPIEHKPDSDVLVGLGWTLRVAPHWIVNSGKRLGDLVLIPK